MNTSLVRMRFVNLLVAALLCAISSPANAEDRVSLKAFFTKPEIGEVRLSPSGRHIALELADENGRVALAVADVELPKRLRIIVADSKLDVRTFRWVNDDWLVFNLIDLQTGSGEQGFGPGLISIRRDGGGSRVLINPTYGVSRETGTNIVSTLLDWRHAFLDVPSNGSNDVLVGEYRFDNFGDPISLNPKRVDVETGRARQLSAGHPAHALGWTFDGSGEPRVIRTSHEGMSEIFWRENGSSGWRSLARFSSQAAPWSPSEVDAAGNLYVTVSSRGATSVLSRFDFKSGGPEASAIVSTPGFDFHGKLIVEEAKVVGVRLVTDAETAVWFDPARKKLQELADARFPDRINRTSCAKCEGDGAMLVYSYSDRDPGTYWIYRPKTAEWTAIGSVRPSIEPRRMATLDLHRIKARDGQDLPVWITTPAEKSAGPRPAVVLVHGGPWVRGTEWHWAGEAQFLASRGYTVIEPEFRGSTGFGFDHFRSGWKNWGTTMQDDVADAARWAVGTGFVDPKRICIAGASYGGYATLMGVIRFPELYRCGVAWVAVTDPRLLYEASWSNDSTREVREFTRPLLMGDLVKDAALLKAAAPVERASEIHIPMLLAFGGADRRVPIDHGNRIRAAMRSAGQEPEYVVYQDEGHGWLKTESELDFWTRVEKFLAKNLGN